MNTKAIPTLLIAAFLSFVLVTGTPFSAAFATGELDDEEEEQKLTELESSIASLKESIGIIELNLTEGVNNIEATCPATQEIVEEVKEVVENVTNNNNTAIPSCNIPEPEPEPQPEPVIPTCNIPEEEPEENKTQDLIPIVCPINGEILAYDNATTPEKEFLPPSVVVEQNQTEPTEQPAAEENNSTEQTTLPETGATEEQPQQDNCMCVSVDSEGQISVEPELEAQQSSFP